MKIQQWRSKNMWWGNKAEYGTSSLIQHFLYWNLYTYAFTIHESRPWSVCQCRLLPRLRSCRSNGSPMTNSGIRKLGTCIEDLVDRFVSSTRTTTLLPMHWQHNRINQLHSVPGSRAKTLQEGLQFLIREKWIWTLLELMLRYKSDGRMLSSMFPG